MPVASIARPINPPSASISRTRCPFAVPPMAGLHGMCATVSLVSVQRATSRPMRAAAQAASTPACPAPMTMTSWYFKMELLPYTEARKDRPQHLVLRPHADNLIERGPRFMQIRHDEFFRDPLPSRRGRALERDPRLSQQRRVPEVCDSDPIANQQAPGGVHRAAAQFLQTVACQRGHCVRGE